MISVTVFHFVSDYEYPGDHPVPSCNLTVSGTLSGQAFYADEKLNWWKIFLFFYNFSSTTPPTSEGKIVLCHILSRIILRLLNKIKVFAEYLRYNSSCPRVMHRRAVFFWIWRGLREQGRAKERKIISINWYYQTVRRRSIHIGIQRTFWNTTQYCILYLLVGIYLPTYFNLNWNGSRSKKVSNLRPFKWIERHCNTISDNSLL